MPSDLTDCTIPQWAARPPPVPSLERTPHRSHKTRRLPLVLKLTMCFLGLFCGAMYWRNPEALLSLSRRELQVQEDQAGGLDSMAGSNESSYDAVKAFWSRRAGRTRAGSRHNLNLSPHAHLQRPLELPPRPDRPLEDSASTALNSSSSHPVLKSFLTSPTADIAKLVILIRGDARTCREHTRRITEEMKAVLEVTSSLDRNAESVCLDDGEYWAHHKDFLCLSWDCTEEVENKLVEAMIAHDETDTDNDQFRLIRGLVFDSLLPDDVKWWGWIGGDVYMGNLQRKFPWDIAHNFDVVIPNAVSLAESEPVALSSKLAFFQRRKSTAELLAGFPAFRSLDAFLTSERATLPAYTDYLLGSKDNSFLAYEAYVAPFNHASLARSLLQTGVFSLFLPPNFGSSSSNVVPMLSSGDRQGYLRLMTQPRLAPHVVGSFTAQGSERTLVPGEAKTFAPLLKADGEEPRFREVEYWMYRLGGRRETVMRSELRSVHQDKDFVINEWTLDFARNHQTDRPQPPPYPPNRLRRGHALTFLPDPSRSSSRHVRLREEIWDDPARPTKPCWWEAERYQTGARIY